MSTNEANIYLQFAEELLKKSAWSRIKSVVWLLFSAGLAWHAIGVGGVGVACGLALASQYACEADVQQDKANSLVMLAKGRAT